MHDRCANTVDVPPQGELLGGGMCICDHKEKYESADDFLLKQKKKNEI